MTSAATDKWNREIMLELVRPILERPFFYELFNSVIGANNCRRVLASEHIRPKSTDRIFDIGCGSGNMLPFLPECGYLGVDLNESYIAAARQRYGHRGEFVFDRVSHVNVEKFGAFDIALAVGMVHHLDDSEARDLFRLAYTALKPGGRLVSMEICHTADESKARRYLLSRDRGQFVRNQEQYMDLAHSCFHLVTPTLRSDLLRLPYTHLIMECVRRDY